MEGENSIYTAMGELSSMLGTDLPVWLLITPHPYSVSKPNKFIGFPG